MTVRESLGRLFRRNTLPPIDPAVPPPFAAICWIAPIPILALPMLLVTIIMVAGWINGHGGPGEDLNALALGLMPLLLGLPIAWTGMFAFGYPVLKLLWKRRISSWIVHALAGGTAGATTMIIVTLAIAASERGKAPDSYGAYAVFGAGMGVVTALLGRWAMTWRWLRD